MYNQTLVFPPQKINMIIGVQDWRCHLCYLGPYWCTSLLESIQLNIIEEGVCRNWWLLKLDHGEKFILIFILSIYKTRLGNLKLNFWEFQHLKNKYEKVYLLLFICNNNPMFGMKKKFTNWEFYSQKYEQMSIKISLFLAKSFVWNMSHK
jgi:hypothetical protein